VLECSKKDKSAVGFRVDTDSYSYSKQTGPSRSQKKERKEDETTIISYQKVRIDLVLISVVVKIHLLPKFIDDRGGDQVVELGEVLLEVSITYANANPINILSIKIIYINITATTNTEGRGSRWKCHTKLVDGVLVRLLAVLGIDLDGDIQTRDDHSKRSKTYIGRS